VVDSGLTGILDSFAHLAQSVRVLGLLTSVSDHVLGSFQRDHKLASRALEWQSEVIVTVGAILILLFEFSHVLAEDLLAALAGEDDLVGLLQGMILSGSMALGSQNRQ
jgi:hypothetical protein